MIKFGWLLCFAIFIVAGCKTASQPIYKQYAFFQRSSSGVNPETIETAVNDSAQTIKDSRIGVGVDTTYFIYIETAADQLPRADSIVIHGKKFTAIKTHKLSLPQRVDIQDRNPDPLVLSAGANRSWWLLQPQLSVSAAGSGPTQKQAIVFGTINQKPFYLRISLQELRPNHRM